MALGLAYSLEVAWIREWGDCTGPHPFLTALQKGKEEKFCRCYMLLGLGKKGNGEVVSSSGKGAGASTTYNIISLFLNMMLHERWQVLGWNEPFICSNTESFESIPNFP